MLESIVQVETKEDQRLTLWELHIAAWPRLLNQSSFMHVCAHLFSCLIMKREILFYMMSNHVNEIFTFRFKLCDHRRPIKLTVSSWTLFSSIKQNKIPSFEWLKISIIDAFNNKQTLKLSKFQSSSSFN